MALKRVIGTVLVYSSSKCHQVGIHVRIPGRVNLSRDLNPRLRQPRTGRVLSKATIFNPSLHIQPLPRISHRFISTSRQCLTLPPDPYMGLFYYYYMKDQTKNMTAGESLVANLTTITLFVIGVSLGPEAFIILIITITVFCGLLKIVVCVCPNTKHHKGPSKVTMATKVSTTDLVVYQPKQLMVIPTKRQYTYTDVMMYPPKSVKLHKQNSEDQGFISSHLRRHNN